MGIKSKELVKLEMETQAIRMGNLACPGCQLNNSFKHCLTALNNNAVVVVPACCTSVIQGAGAGYGMNVPIINTAFAAAPPVAAGIKRSLIEQGKDINVVVWAGDGGTSDIGVAALSGAAERDEDVIYIMYNNAGYQNTGNQKSGATPRATKTTTTKTGKESKNKNIARLMIAHGVKYVATANSAYPLDLFDKVTRAATEFKGHFRYIEIFSNCPPGWNIDTRDTLTVSKLATETGFWPLYEAVDGVITLSKRGKRFEDPAKRKPFSEFMKYQGRFAGVSPDLVELAQKDIEEEWNWVKRFMTPL